LSTPPTGTFARSAPAADLDPCRVEEVFRNFLGTFNSRFSAEVFYLPTMEVGRLGDRRGASKGGGHGAIF
jgi:hypothetical protein